MVVVNSSCGPKVSVIIPCYNHAHYLSDAVNSVLAQTFTDWEAIVVDDGSTDDTREVAAGFTDSRIRYIYQENQGLSAARNTGIAAVQGELVALLDADDMWEPAFLEYSVDVLDREASIGGVYSGFRYVDTQGQLLEQSVCRAVSPEQFRPELLRGNWLAPSAVVVRKSLYEVVGNFDESLRACEDYDMWLRCSEEHKFKGIALPLLRYRRTGDNMSDDIDRMTEAKARVLTKHLGTLDTRVDTWTEVKRLAVSQIHSMRVQECLAQGRLKESAEALLWLLEHRRDFALSLDLWYSLACVHQNKGQRGDFKDWCPERGKADLGALLAERNLAEVPSRDWREMQALAYLALAFLNYGKGNAHLARDALFSSVMGCPALLFTSRVWKLGVRLLPRLENLGE